jgi:hypothetical protein
MGNEGKKDDQLNSTIQGIESNRLDNGIPNVMNDEQVLNRIKERN